MRQRKAKDLDRRIAECEAFLIREPKPECWDGCFPGRAEAGSSAAGQCDPDRPAAGQFDPRRPLYLEIGCGKGDFIIARALDDPGSDYIGVEGQETVLLRALEKAMKDGDCLCNLRFVCAFVQSMDALFEESSLDGIYLNFSDPWPKTRHVKRRLTWRGRLEQYRWALKEGGSLEIKTDNDDLFDFTLEEIAALGWTWAEMTRDLHSTDLPARRFMTEYERKFHRAGKSINYVKVIF